MMHLATSHTHPLRPAPFHDPQVNTTDQPFRANRLRTGVLEKHARPEYGETYRARTALERAKGR